MSDVSNPTPGGRPEDLREGLDAAACPALRDKASADAASEQGTTESAGPTGPSAGPSAGLSAGFAGLSGRQGQAVEALLREPTLTRASAIAGVNQRTLRRWLGEPKFEAALLQARRDAFGMAVGLTQRYAPVAVATLVKVMNDPLASSSAKVAAAAVLLKFGREGIELDDLAQRLEALERAAAMHGGRDGSGHDRGSQ